MNVITFIYLFMYTVPRKGARGASKDNDCFFENLFVFELNLKPY